jgi:hypothetical protein
MAVPPSLAEVHSLFSAELELEYQDRPSTCDRILRNIDPRGRPSARFDVCARIVLIC